MATPNTRDQIIIAADQLIYQQGFDHTSFTHIAEAVNISRGNFYYHFKSKDEILTAVINLRRSNTHQMLKQWEQEHTDPLQRLSCFIQILRMNQDKILRYGCPVGTLSTELLKLDHRASDDATMIFILFRTWLRRQFIALGLRSEADKHAMYLLAQSQGIATMANAFNDSDYLDAQVTQLLGWLDDLIQTTEDI